MARFPFPLQKQYERWRGCGEGPSNLISFSSFPLQAGKSGHSSVEDAQATMELYKLVEVEWEQHLAQNPPKD